MVKEARSQGTGWIVYVKEVCRIMVQRKSAGYLDEKGVWMVWSNSIALKILRISSQKEEKWSGGTKGTITV